MRATYLGRSSVGAVRSIAFAIVFAPWFGELVCPERTIFASPDLLLIAWFGSAMEASFRREGC